MERTGKNKPALVTYGVRIRKFFYINIEPRQLEDGSWSWSQISLSPGGLNYNEIVSKLILLKYYQDKFMSIINNYLNNSSSEDYKTEFLVMQAWRTEAKKIATQAIQYATENGLWEEPENE